MTTNRTTFGDYCRLAMAQATNPTILTKAQDGGTVTALLVHALENKIIDAAIISGTSKQDPFKPLPKLATTPQDIIESAGTRYAYSPNIQVLPEANRLNKKALAFVGTPCQIRAVRRIQQASPQRAKPIKLLIGLMCTEAYTHRGLIINHMQNKLHINPNAIRKMSIKGKMTVTTDADKIKIPLGDLKQYVYGGCGTCNDFSSEQADISAGSLGLTQWTFIITRTDLGDQVFTKAEQAHALATKPVRNNSPSLKMLKKLSTAKHQRSQKNEDTSTRRRSRRRKTPQRPNQTSTTTKT